MGRVDFKDMVKFVDEVIEKPKLFDGLELEPIEEYLGRQVAPILEIKKPMASAFYRAYRIKGSDKIDKIAFGELHYMNRAKYCSMNMTVSDDYDLPIFACEFDESAKRVSITIDFMPVVDMALYPEYRQKYLDPLADAWRNYRTIPGLTDEEGRCLVQRRYGPWPWARSSMSHFPVDGRISNNEDRFKVIEAVIYYAKTWIEIMKNAQPVKDEAYKKEMLTRKRAMQHYYRTLDPGGEVLKKIVGDEMEKLIVSLIF